MFSYLFGKITFSVFEDIHVLLFLSSKALTVRCFGQKHLPNKYSVIFSTHLLDLHKHSKYFANLEVVGLLQLIYCIGQFNTNSLL